MKLELIARTRAINALNELIAVLNSNTRESHLVWDIITALRGPDNDDKVLKSKTTMRIRRVVGLNPDASDTNGGFQCAFVDGGVEAPHDPKHDNHFSAHVSFAIDALKELGYDLKGNNR